MNNLSCQQAASLFSFLIDNEPIPEKEAPQFEAHLAGCEHCRQHLEQLRQTEDTINLTIDSASKRHLTTAELRAFANQKIASEPQQRKIQAHLQSCESCQQLYEFVKQSGQFQPQFELSRKSILTRSSWLEWLKHIIEKLDSLLPAPRILIPVAVTIILAFFTFNIIYERISTPSSLAELAETSPYPYFDTGLRTSQTLLEQLHYRGMKYYVQKDYSLAAEKLNQVVVQDSTNTSARFYLGICYFMENRLNAAEKHFRTYIQAEPTKARGYWYLAQIYLIQENKAKALNTLEKVVVLNEDPFSEKARQVIEKISRVKQ